MREYHIDPIIKIDKSYLPKIVKNIKQIFDGIKI